MDESTDQHPHPDVFRTQAEFVRLFVSDLRAGREFGPVERDATIGYLSAFAVHLDVTAANIEVSEATDRAINDYLVSKKEG